MSTYVLIHGAGSDSEYWHLVVPLLRARGHDVVAPDLPCDDDSAGFEEYVQATFDVIGERTNLVVVGQSMGSFTATLLSSRIPVEALILLAAMVPAVGETAGDWWENTRWAEARCQQAVRLGRPENVEFDLIFDFFNDFTPEQLAAAMAHPQRNQSGTPFEKPWPLVEWPHVPTAFLLCRDDHFFPAEFQRRVVRERLGFEPDEMDGGHLPALSRPEDLVDHLEAIRTRLTSAVE
jgi:pimeloyl-ACP methyl ester carboxylesterase